LYYTKPPLFNWAIAFSFWIAGSYSEIAARMPGLLSFFATGILLYWFARQLFSKEKALLSALFFSNCFRYLPVWNSDRGGDRPVFYPHDHAANGKRILFLSTAANGWRCSCLRMYLQHWQFLQKASLL
jgi:hypothetical protein